MRLIIVRHGETEANANGTLQGHQDNPLNARGMRQAAILSEHLRPFHFTRAYSSDLKRAAQTCAICLEGRGLLTVQDINLRERGYGTFEGQPIDVHMAAFHAAAQPKDAYRPPHGESYRDVEARAVKFLEGIRLKASERDTILVVAHGGFNRMFLKVLLDLSYAEAFKLDQNNCCVNEVVITKRSGTAVRINCIEHLEGSTESN